MEFEIKMDFDLYVGIISYNMVTAFMPPLWAEQSRYNSTTARLWPAAAFCAARGAREYSAGREYPLTRVTRRPEAGRASMEGDGARARGAGAGGR